jgi:hypothetical protein
VVQADDVRGSFVARVVRRPGLHFLVLGALLFAISRVAPRRDIPDVDDRDSIVVTALDIERIRRDWKDEYGQSPDLVEEERLVQQAIEEEILHREALALGLHRGDRVVRRRLVQLAGFLGDPAAQDGGQDPGDVDEDALEREARSIGLDRTDIVIRRYLVQMMRLLLARPRPADLPTPQELDAYFAAHEADFARPARMRLTHVYLSRDRRGEALEEDAASLLETLRRTRVDPHGVEMGEPFARGADIGPASERDLERTLGPAFVPALAGAASGEWVGPVPSTYGLHLVWIHERVAGGAPPLEAVRSQAVHRFLRARQDERLRDRLRELRGRYDIRDERAAAVAPAAGARLPAP